MSTTITRDIPELQRMAHEFGFRCVAIYPGPHKGFGEHHIVIDWNGDTEMYPTFDLAEQALRSAAQ